MTLIDKSVFKMTTTTETYMFTSPHPSMAERDGCNGQIHEEAIAEVLLPTREAGQGGRRSLPGEGRGR